MERKLAKILHSYNEFQVEITDMTHNLHKE